MTCAGGLSALPFPLFASCNHKEHLGGVLLVPREEKRNSHIDGERGNDTPKRVRVHVPLGVNVSPFNHEDGPGHRVGKRLCLPEQVAVDEGVDKVPGGLALDEDTVADRVIALRQAFEPIAAPSSDNTSTTFDEVSRSSTRIAGPAG